ncbi:MAG TPA: adenylate/guanylate cyclase domain-containing protein, partial [Actinomycetota bacterium]|nr:adenylate/guanylate cyclase domain-containing protein [Actinomycetota bacterium]
MDIPETRYTNVGDSQVAYQVFGEGPDLVYSTGFISHVDHRWDDPGQRRFLSRLASFSRMIVFDRRGTGASDALPAGEGPTWEHWVDDLNAVLEAVGSERPSILANTDAGPMAMLFAATYPDRVSSLILTNTAARGSQAPDYPHGLAPEFQEPFLQTVEEGWGKEDGALMRILAPEHAEDPEFVRWLARMQRASMTPRRAAEHWRIILGIDARHVLPLIRVPTLVIGLSDVRSLPVANSEYLAEHIDGARLLVLRGTSVLGPYLSEPDRLVAAIEEMVTGEHRPVMPDRILATVLLTDIVASTERASELGDRRWRELLDRHDRIAARHVDRFGGRVVKGTGDGILAMFDGPARAVGAATEIRDELERSGITIRSGLHAGEVEVRGDDVGGIAVHIAARVMALAPPGEILVSSTVKGLVAGSGIACEDRGTHTLKGVPDEWVLHAVPR